MFAQQLYILELSRSVVRVMRPLTVETARNRTVLILYCRLDGVPKKNFRFFEFLELFKIFRRGLTNYFFKKCCAGANFQPIMLAAGSFDS